MARFPDERPIYHKSSGITSNFPDGESSFLISSGEKVDFPDGARQLISKTDLHISIKMKTELRTLTFSEKESICEREFEMSGPFWHLFTDGRNAQNIFQVEKDLELGTMLFSVSCCKNPDVRIITFEIMNNHLHIIAAGQRTNCLALFGDYKKRLMRVLPKREHFIEWSVFRADIIPIETLKALRNEIIYVNRNAYVANPRYTPSNYPWGGGYAYFCPLIKNLRTTDFNEMSYDQKRRVAHCRDISQLDRLKFIENMGVLVTSFCDIALGERMFPDARSYFNSLTRNAESFSLIAERLKDSVFLTDDELYHAAVKYVEKNFGIKSLTGISPEQKVQLATELHFRYRATNQQIRRITRLDLQIINEIFP